MSRIAIDGRPIRRHEAVVANIDLPGVPIGTRGKVLLPTGITWRRYRVLFDNGVEIGQLDRRHIVPPHEFVPPQDRAPEGSAPSNGAGGAEEADGPDAPDGAAENRSGVPAHLLERSKRARERLAAGG